VAASALDERERKAMPQRNSSIGRTLFRLLFLSIAGWALDALVRGCRRLTLRSWDEWDQRAVDVPVANEPKQEPVAQRRLTPRRLATAFVFSTLFFAGAAFSAGAGDQFRGLLEKDGDTSSMSTYTAPSDGAAAPDATAAPDASAVDTGAAPQPPPADPSSDGAAPPAPSPEAGAAPSDPSSGDSSSESNSGGSGGSNESDALSAHENGTPAAPAEAPAKSDASVRKPARAGAKRSHRVQPKPRPRKPQPLDPEVTFASGATVWINRALPDPTPPALRLQPRFARELAATAKGAGVDWAFVLAVLRAKGSLGSVPAAPLTLRGVVRRVSSAGARKDAWGMALAFSGQTAFADRVAALTHYYRAVGLNALTTGLEAAKQELVNRVLADSRVSIYPAGRDDLASGRVNVRVVALIEYLADTFGQVSVSCLISGHRLYARPGVISAHIFGRAVDVSSLGGVPIAGHQQSGSVTEQAVRSILFLPPGMRPAQVISLLGLGGPSFPLANHWDHIHVGY
jgi:hypothetical protein